jgi:hypothetical protein
MDQWTREKNSSTGVALLERAQMLDPTVGAGFQAVVAEPVPNVAAGTFAVILHGVLSQHECAALIQCIPREGRGFMDSADIGRRYRDRVCNRFLSDDLPFAALVFSRIRPFLPKRLDGGTLIGLSPLWRFLHYEQGGHQGCHIDGREPGSTLRHSCVESRLTVQLYLNSKADCYEGGRLLFGKAALAPPTTRGAPVTSPAFTIEQSYAHEPVAGDAVVFYQEEQAMRQTELQCLHAGEEVLSGTKYACRTMVEYGFEQ